MISKRLHDILLYMGFWDDMRLDEPEVVIWAFVSTVSHVWCESREKSKRFFIRLGNTPMKEVSSEEEVIEALLRGMT